MHSPQPTWLCPNTAAMLSRMDVDAPLETTNTFALKLKSKLLSCNKLAAKQRIKLHGETTRMRRERQHTLVRAYTL